MNGLRCGAISLVLLLGGCKTLYNQATHLVDEPLLGNVTPPATDALDQGDIDPLTGQLRPLLDPQTEAELVAAEAARHSDDNTAGPANTAEQAAEANDNASSELYSELNDEPLPFVEADLWQRTRDNLQLDLSSHDPRVEAQLKWYSGHPRYLERVATRATRYYHYVLEETLRRGLPAELALLPIVESAYDPFAYSHGRAAGPWQFIPGTAKHFGLKSTWWYDGRRDIVASTNAALDYLTQLHDLFDGDWLLALASYNAGQGNVLRAVKRNKKRGKPTDFWNLDLPRETSAYVPKLIALAKLIKEPQEYNIELLPIPDEPYFAEVDIGSQIDLAKAAELAEISLDELYLLNPGFNQWATDPNGPHRLLIPAENEAQFRTALADYPAEKRITWKRYKVRSGDSLIRIAKTNHTTPATLRKANGLRDNLIRVGETLLIPTASEPAAVYAYSTAQRQEKKNERIALRSGRQQLSYEVQSGDSFWTIARRYNVGVRQLAAWNQMAPGDPLRIGKKLVIWQPQNILTTASNSQRQVIRKVGYKVRSGDSLARIASRFRVRVSDIKRWNNRIADKKYLQPGDQLTLFVDVTNR